MAISIAGEYFLQRALSIVCNKCIGPHVVDEEIEAQSVPAA